MFISKKRWQALIKRVADLEVQVQSQQKVRFMIDGQELAKAVSEGARHALKSQAVQAR